MKHIFFIREISANMGGVETQVYRLARNFYEKGIFQPVLITSNLDAPLSRLFIESGFEVFTVDFKNLIRGSFQLNTLIKKYDVALIQSHMFRESILGRLTHILNLNVPHIFRVHTYIDCSWIPEYKKNLYHLLEKITNRLVNSYICINESARTELVNRSKVNPSKIRLVSNAVDRLTCDVVDDIPRIDTKKIAMIANLIPHKGHDILIKGLSILKQKNILIKARLIGGEKTADVNNSEDTYTNYLVDLAKRNDVFDQIDFFGYTKNVYDALEGYSIVVLPSDSEGTPNSLLEAMSVKKLVIASEVGGIPEFITDKISGFLHKPQSPGDFAGVIESVTILSADELDRIANVGYSIWNENYRTEVIINRFISCYRELGIL